MKKFTFLMMLVIVSFGMATIAGHANSQISSAFQVEKSNSGLYATAVANHNYDVLHYKITLNFDPGQKRIDGSTTIRFLCTENNIQQVEFDMVGLNVDSVIQTGVRLNYELTDELIRLSLDRAYTIGDTVAVEIFYGGKPVRGLYFTSRAIYSLNDPIDARRWFPCFDHPSDKATLEIQATVPTGKIVAANGRLVDTIENSGSGTVTYIWRHDYPITAYNIHVGIANFATFSHEYNGIPILYYVYPEDLANARISFQNIPAMMAYMIDHFGPYPFEKYGMDELPLANYLAMEHQTMVSILPSLVTGDNSSDDTFAHELSHMWFGNSVSIADWHYMWLNEGFASYIEADYIRQAFGEDQFRQKMNGYKSSFFAEDATIRYPLSNPPWDYIFGQTIYRKGAWVVYMLHTLLGDDTFWQIMATWAERYAYANATIDDFHGHCEEISGQNLDVFFNQWVHTAGYPEYIYSTYSCHLGNNRYRVDVSVVQSHKDGPVYQLPVEIYVKTGQGDTTATFTMDEKAENFTLTVTGAPQEILWDAGNKILCRASHIPGYTRPILQIDQVLIDDDAGNHNRVLSYDEVANLVVVLKNRGITRENIRARLRTESTEIAILQDSCHYQAMALFESRDNASNAFVIKSNDSKAWHHIPMQLIVTADPAYLDTLHFHLPIGEPDLLMVDSDRASGCYQKYGAILDSLKVGYAYWDADQYGSPFILTHPYKTLIWFTGMDSTNFLSETMEDSLKKFLDSGGNLFLSGRHIANALHNRDFFRDYLHVTWNGETQTYILSCAGNDPICTGDKLVLESRDGAQDILVPVDPANTAIIMTYLGSQNGAAIRFTGQYKMVYLGFGLEDVVANNPRLLSSYDLVHFILNWFAGIVGVRTNDNMSKVPDHLEIYPNFPNPFNTETVLRYHIAGHSNFPVRVTIQNLLGQTVKIVIQKNQSPGDYEVKWDGTDQNGIPAGTGTYIAVVQVGAMIKTTKMLLVR